MWNMFVHKKLKAKWGVVFESVPDFQEVFGTSEKDWFKLEINWTHKKFSASHKYSNFQDYAHIQGNGSGILFVKITFKKTFRVNFWCAHLTRNVRWKKWFLSEMCRPNICFFHSKKAWWLFKQRFHILMAWKNAYWLNWSLNTFCFCEKYLCWKSKSFLENGASSHSW